MISGVCGGVTDSIDVKGVSQELARLDEPLVVESLGSATNSSLEHSSKKLMLSRREGVAAASFFIATSVYISGWELGGVMSIAGNRASKLL